MGRVLPFPADRVRREPLPDARPAGQILLFTGVRYEFSATPPVLRPSRRRPRTGGA